jgi:SAM-dependent methyltransferase
MTELNRPQPRLDVRGQPDEPANSPGRSALPTPACATPRSTSPTKAPQAAHVVISAAGEGCRFCAGTRFRVMADLGMSPIAYDYRLSSKPPEPMIYHPLQALVCERCLLVQSPTRSSAQDLFGAHYPYFSSYADTMLAHARDYARSSAQRLALDAESLVVEVGSNDGYLLRWFAELGIPTLGIEPAHDTAEAARALGLDVREHFFGEKAARQLRSQGIAADLIPANNVVAHVPDLNDFVEGFRVLLKPQGVASFEFHHLLNLIQERQFDAIYHEHFYYHSLSTFTKILAAHGLEVFDAERIATHGGSLRVWAQRAGSGQWPINPRVDALMAEESAQGLDDLDRYAQVDASIRLMKRQSLDFLIRSKSNGLQIAGYGAPAKASTILNYLGVRSDFIDFIADRNPHKHGRVVPGTGITIVPPEQVFERKPQILLIFAWNLCDEIAQQMSEIRQWNGRFAVLVPEVRVF